MRILKYIAPVLIAVSLVSPVKAQVAYTAAWVDSFTSQAIAGWVYDSNQPTKVTIQLKNIKDASKVFTFTVYPTTVRGDVASYVAGQSGGEDKDITQPTGFYADPRVFVNVKGTYRLESLTYNGKNVSNAPIGKTIAIEPNEYTFRGAEGWIENKQGDGWVFDNNAPVRVTLEYMRQFTNDLFAVTFTVGDSNVAKTYSRPDISQYLSERYGIQTVSRNTGYTVDPKKILPAGSYFLAKGSYNGHPFYYASRPGDQNGYFEVQ